MWKKNLKIIKTRDINYSIQEYCLWFSYFFNIEILPLSSFIINLEKENGDLLPISKNICDFFYNGDLNNFVNFIYHIDDLNCLDFLIINQQDIKKSDLFFNNKKSSFFDSFSLDLELLLSVDNDNNKLIFLFLFFLPTYKNKDLFIHPKKGIPLIACHKITQENFEMLLYLMKSFDGYFESFSSNSYNLNLILIEDFCQNSNQFFFGKEKDDWYSILPIEKIKKLFKERCYLNNFSTERNKKLYYTIPTLNEFIIFFQKELEVEFLEKKLTNKNGQSLKTKTIKI